MAFLHYPGSRKAEPTVVQRAISLKTAWNFSNFSVVGTSIKWMENFGCKYSIPAPTVTQIPAGRRTRQATKRVIVIEPRCGAFDNFRFQTQFLPKSVINNRDTSSSWLRNVSFWCSGLLLTGIQFCGAQSAFAKLFPATFCVYCALAPSEPWLKAVSAIRRVISFGGHSYSTETTFVSLPV